MNYTRSSVVEVEKLTEEEREWWGEVLAILAREPWNNPEGAPGVDAWSEEPKGIEADVKRIVVEHGDWGYWGLDAGIQGDELMIWGDEDGNLDVMAAMLQLFLKLYRPKDSIGFTWGWIERGGGGGAMFITAKKISAVSTDDWLAEQHEKMKKRAKNAKRRALR